MGPRRINIQALSTSTTIATRCEKKAKKELFLMTAFDGLGGKFVDTFLVKSFVTKMPQRLAECDVCLTETFHLNANRAASVVLAKFMFQ